MLALLTRRWRIMLLNGACALVFAMLVFSWDSITASGLAFCLGLYCLVNGVTAIAVARGAKRRINKLWPEFLAIGLLSFGAGSLFMLWRDGNMEALAMIAAVWAMSIGITETWIALKIHQLAPADRLFFMIGAASILLDLILAALVLLSVPAVPRALACMMAVRGGLMIALSLKLLGYRLMAADIARERHSATELIRFATSR